MNPTLPIPLRDQVSALVGRKLLVIDDDEAMLQAVSKVLHHGGATVQSARSVSQAIELLAGKGVAYDAVLTDLRMPVTSGKYILGVIRNTNPNVPVLMMSAFWTEEIKEECTQLGATGLLDKPLSSVQLLATVANALLAPHGAS